MAVDRDVLRSARNGFLSLMVVTVLVGVAQFVLEGRVAAGTAVIWLFGAIVFYGSKYYYGRSGAD
ncbi:MAG: hypothetical protein ABEH64_09585 [Salinirussus sp.]